MIKVVQTIGLENGADINDYYYFKTKNGKIGLWNVDVEAWWIINQQDTEFYVDATPFHYGCTLKELNDYVREKYDGDEITGMSNTGYRIDLLEE